MNDNNNNNNHTPGRARMRVQDFAAVLGVNRQPAHKLVGGLSIRWIGGLRTNWYPIRPMSGTTMVPAGASSRIIDRGVARTCLLHPNRTPIVVPPSGLEWLDPVFCHGRDVF